MARSKARKQRDIERYIMDVAQGYGEKFLASITPEQEQQLAGIPHPKLPNSDLTAMDYIAWMCGKGWHKKAKALFNELITGTNTDEN
ncbi:hypothetical protein N9A81_01885 [Synechococcus sp. AH-707-M23]|nr:hypothetical protein [Synechococcus sp. AH-707-M23]